MIDKKQIQKLLTEIESNNGFASMEGYMRRHPEDYCEYRCEGYGTECAEMAESMFYLLDSIKHILKSYETELE